MKKSILTVLFASTLLIACKKEENKIQEPMTDPPVESVNEAPQNTAEDITILTAPNFQYAEADQFAKEYVEFIKKYSESSYSLSMLSDYIDFMSKYTGMVERMEAINDDELSAADYAYYIEVTTRIYKMLAEAL